MNLRSPLIHASSLARSEAIIFVSDVGAVQWGRTTFGCGDLRLDPSAKLWCGRLRRLSSRRFTQLTDAALMLDDGTRKVMDVVVLCIAPGTSYILNVLQYLYITL